MSDIICERCKKEPAICKVFFLNKYLCSGCDKKLGDYDQKGRLDDKRIKR